MKTIYVMLLMLIANLGFSQSAEKGEVIFNDNCKACHTVGGGKLVGPDLMGVSERRKPDWLLKFINSPKKMIDGGDSEAVKLFEEHNKVMMPDHAFITSENVQDLIAYFQSAANAKVEVAKEPPVAVDQNTDVSDPSIKQESAQTSNTTSVIITTLFVMIFLLLALCFLLLIRIMKSLKG